jgi:hypothetical protein
MCIGESHRQRHVAGIMLVSCDGGYEVLYSMGHDAVASCWLVGFLFDTQIKAAFFRRNVSLLPDYTSLHSKRYYSSVLHIK